MKINVCFIQKTFEDGRIGQRMELNGNTVIPLTHNAFAEIVKNLNLSAPTEVIEHEGEKEELFY